MLKELIRALLEIRNALLGKSNNNEQSTNFSWLDVIKIITPELEDEPLYIIGTDDNWNLDLNTIQCLKDVSAYQTLKCFQIESESHETTLGIFLFDKQLIMNGNCYNALALEHTGIYTNVLDFSIVKERTIELEGKTYYYYFI